MGFPQSTRARNCNNSVFDEAKEIVQFSNQCLVERRDTLGIQSSSGDMAMATTHAVQMGPKQNNDDKSRNDWICDNIMSEI